ncbi:RNA polymerase I-specific transcription initiation factor rrn3 [Escovopsis weberi]|uniref:RNA polymerase I-specific transcription initiation factor rrn3 n=1 Tax=Escovopsis weberi TaxID=150374 RepID=A0A0M8MVW6_ESCWE|nr:RNA polymerase I-specific transcription initiation factor rrn3 [Escovopsis weberi]
MRPFSPSARSLPGSLPRSRSPAKSILKPPSILGGRKDRHDALSSDFDPQDTPSKRRKVFFDDIKNVTYEVGRRTMDEVKLEVRTALEGHLRGEDGQYDTLKEMFANDKQRYLPPVVGQEDDTLKPHELQVYVMALTGCVPILKNKECNGLVRTMLHCSWLGRDAAFVKVFSHFLTALVSAQGSYLNVVLSMLVDKFHHTRRSQWSVPDFPEVGRDVMRQRLHSTLQYILQMFPSAAAVLESLLGAKFPFPDESMRVHMAYIHNLLRVKDYVPDLADDIYDMILNRVVKIDSQMQLDLEDMDDEIAAAVMFALRESPREPADWEQDADDEDDEDDESDRESVHSDDADYDPEAVRIKTVKESVEKMDAVLDTLFGLYTPHFLNPGSDKAFDMFTTILREFDQMVLPTYKSRHTQFLIFHFAQQHERLTDAFCGQLIATAFQGNTPNILKQAAAAYLASFVARGAHVPQSLVRTIFLLLLHHLDRYRRKYEPLCRGPDLKRFHPYYSLLQATLYIFCFRWQDLVVDAPDVVDPDDPASYIGQDLEWVGSSKQSLSIHVFGKLNPLKVCAPVIVEEFAKLAHRLNFMYTYPLIENNKRVRLTQFLSSTYSTGGALRDSGFDAQEESFHQLDPYFPFDPYQLPISKRWLADDYVHWKSVPGLNADDDSDDSEEDEDDEREEVELEFEELEEVEEETATDSDGDDYE